MVRFKWIKHQCVCVCVGGDGSSNISMASLPLNSVKKVRKLNNLQVILLNKTVQVSKVMLNNITHQEANYLLSQFNNEKHTVHNQN